MSLTVRLVKLCGHCGREFGRDPRNTWAYWERAKYCSRQCAGTAIAQHRVANRPPREVVFSKWFEKTDGCWEWQGAKDPSGYGAFSYAGKMSKAHRVALELDGRPPGKLFACHHCDNPSCVRPDHLFVGTNADNMRDMVAKGRNPNRLGENNPNWRGGRRSASA